MLFRNQLGANARTVCPIALELHREVRIAVANARIVAVDRRGRIDVVDDKIQRAAVVQVHVNRTVGKATLPDAPRRRHVRKVQVAVVAEHVVGHGYLRHLFEQREIFLRNALGQRRLHGRVAHEIDVIEIVRSAENPAGDEQVLEAVVVEIRKQCRPAPVGGVYAGQIGDLAESAVPAIELQRVARILRMVPCLETEIEQVEALGVGRCLQHILALRHHVGNKNVRAAVVVEVGRIHAHRETTGVPRGRGNRFGERAIAIVVIQEIIFLKVVGNVQIHTAVAIEVAGNDAEPEPFDAAEDASLGTDVDKATAIVAIHPATAQRTPHIALERGTDRTLGVRRMTQQKEIEIAVVVVIEKRGLR